MKKTIKFINLIKVISTLGPYSFSYKLACLLSDLYSPRHSEDNTVLNNIKNSKIDLRGDSLNTIFKKYHHHIAINYLNTFLYKKLKPNWVSNNISFDGLEHLQRDNKQGILVLTAHQHSLMMLGVAFGLIGNKIHPVLLDPAETVPDSLKAYFKTAIKDSAVHYNNGNYILVRMAPSYTRSIYHTFNQGNMIISANDFPKNIAPKRRIDIPFFEQHISCPTGTIEIALKTQSKIVTAFISKGINTPFHISIKPISLKEKNLNDIVQQYGSHLQQAIETDIGAWEGWKWDNLFND